MVGASTSNLEVGKRGAPSKSGGFKSCCLYLKTSFFSTSRFIDRQNGSQNYQHRDRVAAESFRARAQELFGKQVGRIGFIASCHIASISGKCRRRSTCCFPARRMCSVSSLSYLGVYTWPAQEWHVDTRTALTIQNTPFSSYNILHCSAVHQCKMKRSRGIVHDKLDNMCSTLLPSCQSMRFVLPRPVAGIRQRDIFFIFLISLFISVNIKVVMDTNFDLIASYYRDTYIQGFILILRSAMFMCSQYFWGNAL